MIGDLSNSGSMPVLADLMRFTARRQTVIAHNIANLDTPGFLQTDASPEKFQEALREAVEKRRNATGGERGELPAFETDEVRRLADGSIRLMPGTPSGNILYHDRNNRDLERLMQDLSENGLMYRVSADLMRRQTDLLRSAIAQRP